MYFCGDGYDVLEGKATVITQTGKDVTETLIKASKKMLEIAQQNDNVLAILMDVSGAYGSQVIYDGSSYTDNPKYQIGMGACAAQLHRNGIEVISQRDFASLEILYPKLDEMHMIERTLLIMTKPIGIANTSRSSVNFS